MNQDVQLIAPCGMNCGFCYAFLRTKKHCPGCRGDDSDKMVSCLQCIIKNCEALRQNQSGFCYECTSFPCRRLKDLDKRYRTKYRMSMLENLEYIKEKGLDAFIDKEKERWRCPTCGGVICVHKGRCYSCGTSW